MKSKTCLGLLLLLVFAFSLQAHDLWVANTDDGYAVIRGHLPDRFDDYDPKCVQALTAFDEKGLSLPLKRLDREQRVFVEMPSSPALVAVISKWGVPDHRRRRAEAVHVQG